MLVLLLGLGAAAVVLLRVSNRREHRAGEQLREGLERLYRVIDQAGDAILVVDGRGRVVLLNESGLELFGVEPGDVLGQPVERLVPLPTRDGHAELVAGYMGDGARRVMAPSRPVEALRGDGTTVPVSITLSRVELHGEYAVVAVVSDRRPALAQEALRQSNEALGAFASVAAHDLQAPLRHIGILVDVLRHQLAGKLSSDDEEKIGQVMGSVSRARSLIRDLLAFARAPAVAHRRVPVDLGPIAARAAELSKHGEVHVGPMPVVQGDPDDLERVFQNLVSNALKFHRPGERAVVRIWAESSPEGHTLVVEDEGIGISADEIERIFEPFRRLHSKNAFPGTGLGLAICRRLVDAHGGSLRAESDGERGSRFVMWLPA